MTIDPVADLKQPPIVGKYYLVPAVFMARSGPTEEWWPIHGSLHEDKDFFDFPHQHYHVDQRFLTRRHMTMIGNYIDGRDMGPIERSFAIPVSGQYAHAPRGYPGRQEAPPAPVLRKMRCMRAMPPIPRAFDHTKLHEHYAGTVAKTGRLGLVCPHRQYPLGQCKPDSNGIVTCPLHGLRIRTADGVCVRPDATKER